VHLEGTRPLRDALLHLRLQVRGILGDRDVEKEIRPAARPGRLAPRLQGVDEPLPLLRVGEVPERRHPAEKRRAGAAVEIVGGDLPTDGEELHMHVRIDRAREDDQPLALHCAHLPRLPRASDAEDPPSPDRNVRPLHPARGQHLRVPDDELHAGPPLLSVAPHRP